MVADLVRLQLQSDLVDPDTEILLQLIEYWSMAEILRLGVLAHCSRKGTYKGCVYESCGTGYTHTDVPKITFDSPVGYDDLQLIGSSTGVGASVTVDVGAGLSISSFKLNNIGYGFTQGEQLRIAGIPTVTSIDLLFKTLYSHGNKR